MEWGYLGPRDSEGKQFHIRKGQYIAGHAIGIVLLEVWYPLLPGNVVNATTYDFPVRYKVLRGATQERILRADPTLVDLVIDAGRELEMEGVRAVVGACGYFANYQREVAAALDVPVFLSSLLQVPLISRSLKPGQRVGILCADAASLRKSALEACGIDDDVPVVVSGMENKPEFGAILHSNRGEFDYDRVEGEVVESALQLVQENPNVGALLLECSDMPPFAAAVQRAIRLPVFDFITMIRWIQNAVVQRPYEGYC